MAPPVRVQVQRRGSMRQAVTISVGFGLLLPVVVAVEIIGGLGLTLATTTMAVMTMRTPTTSSAAVEQAEGKVDSGELVALAGAAVEADQVVRAVAVAGRRARMAVAQTVETKETATTAAG